MTGKKVANPVEFRARDWKDGSGHPCYGIHYRSQQRGQPRWRLIISRGKPLVFPTAAARDADIERRRGKPRKSTPTPAMSPNRLQAARRKAKLSQGEVASATGVSLSLIKHWETGRSRPSPAHLQAIADACGCPIEDLAWGSITAEERYQRAVAALGEAYTLEDRQAALSDVLEQAKDIGVI